MWKLTEGSNLQMRQLQGEWRLRSRLGWLHISVLLNVDCLIVDYLLKVNCFYFSFSCFIEVWMTNKNCICLRWIAYYFNISIPHAMITTLKLFNMSLASHLISQRYHFVNSWIVPASEHSVHLLVAIFKKYNLHNICQYVKLIMFELLCGSSITEEWNTVI